MPSAGSEAPIYLVGMMGAGKTAVGAALARAIGRRFVDLDAHIEVRSGRSIAAIFARGGEAARRGRLNGRTYDGLRERVGRERADRRHVGLALPCCCRKRKHGVAIASRM